MNRKTFVTNKPPIEPTHRWEDGKSVPGTGAIEPFPVVDGVFYALPPETTEEGVPLPSGDSYPDAQDSYSYPSYPIPGKDYPGLIPDRQVPPGAVVRPLTPEEVKRITGRETPLPESFLQHKVIPSNPTPAPTPTKTEVTTEPKGTSKVVVKFSGKEASLILRVLEGFSLGATGSICDSDLGPGDAQVVTMELAEPYLTRLKLLIRNYSHFATWDGKAIL